MTQPQTPRIVALLPMKANSNRVKGKNFRYLCGKPLFRWILDTLLQIDEIDTVVINTDARQILESNGLIESDRIVIRDRNELICGDSISMNDVLADDVCNFHSDIYLMTHTTNPLLSSNTIKKCIDLFINKMTSDEADSLFTVNKHQTRFYSADCKPINHDPSNLVPTQDLEPWYEENSNLYIFTKESFSKTNARIGLKPIMYASDPFESFDIDEEHDWNIVQSIAKQRGGSK